MSESTPSTSFVEIAKSEFLLLGAFLLFLGIISTDAYYREFGLRFQFLCYPWSLIVFRGILTIVRFPLLWLLVAEIVLVVEGDRTLARSTTFRFQRWRIGVKYAFAAILVACMPWLGTMIGAREAQEDMCWSHSTLPKNYKIVSMDGTEQQCDRCLLLMLDSSELVYFVGTNGGSNDVPRTKILARSSIQRIDSTR